MNGNPGMMRQRFKGMLPGKQVVRIRAMDHVDFMPLACEAVRKTIQVYGVPSETVWRIES